VSFDELIPLVTSIFVCVQSASRVRYSTACRAEASVESAAKQASQNVCTKCSLAHYIIHRFIERSILTRFLTSVRTCHLNEGPGLPKLSRAYLRSTLEFSGIFVPFEQYLRHVMCETRLTSESQIVSAIWIEKLLRSGLPSVCSPRCVCTSGRRNFYTKLDMLPFRLALLLF
jgi:hypothetical protein